VFTNVYVGGPGALSVQDAQEWFQQVITANNNDQPSFDLQTKDLNNRFAKVYRARPTLEHVYMDPYFRIAQSVRQAGQKPSYTIATRIIESESECKDVWTSVPEGKMLAFRPFF